MLLLTDVLSAHAARSGQVSGKYALRALPWPGVAFAGQEPSQAFVPAFRGKGMDDDAGVLAELARFLIHCNGDCRVCAADMLTDRASATC